ncbi:hypothetical protein RhiirA4_488102 [Rhizophagus irregularis]|uniref:Uncharacterized protein n=1 Tax=Rhizophagus irregularis TaxID=588596 RepID=A0A2I1HTB5_9GLOM|nr:hypothetical protein RhiirA4_488102 [Rhizophagus irregularis]
MNVISNGKTINYSSSGIFDERVKITKSNPNKLKGFVILVVGFRRVLWRSVEDIISNYSYDNKMQLLFIPSSRMIIALKALFDCKVVAD